MDMTPPATTAAAAAPATPLPVLPPKATILVVDDDNAIRTLLAESLGAHGYAVETAADAREMDMRMARAAVDLLVLDVMLPGEDGLSICRRLARDGGPQIILLSALGDEADRIIGLEIGATHYLPKPCSPREILATVRAALRHRETPRSPDQLSYHFAGWRIGLAAHELIDPDGAMVDLTDGEFAVLRAFVERPRRVLSRETLLEAARGPDSESFDRAIDVQVSRLRRKLRARDDEIIRTIRNEGYFFVPRVTRA